jgi:transcriptional regulator GlxA family with amidase domain
VFDTGLAAVLDAFATANELAVAQGLTSVAFEETARYLIVDSRPSQAAYAMSGHLAHADPLVQRFERWARDHLADGFSLDEAAHAIGVSKRTLARRINDVLGKSPLSY